MECGDLSPLLTGRQVGPHKSLANRGVTSPAVKSGDKSPHSIKHALALRLSAGANLKISAPIARTNS
jgi:hypothetical protein